MNTYSTCWTALENYFTRLTIHVFFAKKALFWIPNKLPGFTYVKGNPKNSYFCKENINFKVRERSFQSCSLYTVCMCKLYQVHSYPKNFISRSDDVYIDFQNEKRAQRHIFRNPSSLRRQFQGRKFDENSYIFIKNQDFSCFTAVYELRNVLNVFRNTLNMFSDLKLIRNGEGLH